MRESMTSLCLVVEHGVKIGRYPALIYLVLQFLRMLIRILLSRQSGEAIAGGVVVKRGRVATPSNLADEHPGRLRREHHVWISNPRRNLAEIWGSWGCVPASRARCGRVSLQIHGRDMPW